VPEDPSSNSGKPRAGSAGSEDPLIEAALRQLGSAPPAGGPSPPTPGSDGLGFIGIPPDLFPGYIVVRELHRGGQGVVYQAIHKSTKRKVAIKVMKEGPFTGPREKARFDREIEVLAQLDHPNIVTIHDSGVLPPDKGGLHYFVMDYISGKSLDRYIEENKLDKKAIIALFAKVCDAVNAAHLKGVIHRDLKPTNIRVDANGEPHILDFGLAKVAGGSVLGGESPELMTVTGQFIGSPAWASPEQAVGDVSKIDTRTDVYSIGVMLYKALTNRFPYAVVGMLREVLENIEKAIPAKPSTVGAKVGDEVETIVLKALAKERERRYQNAGELGRDLRNYLEGNPIEAKRDSVWYLVRKAVARRRMLAAAVLAVALSLTVGLVVSLSFWRVAEKALAETRAARDLAEKHREEAEKAKVLAQLEAAKARRVGAFINAIFAHAEKSLLTGSGPQAIVELLRQGEFQAQAELGAEPLVYAAVLDSIGRAYLAFDRLDLADATLEKALELRIRALGPDANAPDLADSYESLSELRTVRGEYDAALRQLNKALPIRRAVHGPESLEVARTEHMIARTHAYLKDWAQAEQWYTAALERARRVAPDSLEVAEFQTSLAFVYKQVSPPDFRPGEPDLTRAISLLSSARALASQRLAGEDNIAGGLIKSHLADCLLRRDQPGDVDEAVRLSAEVAASYVRIYAPLNDQHPVIVQGHVKHARALAKAGRHDAAEQAYRAALAACSRDTPDAAARRQRILQELIKFFQDTGQAGKAEEARGTMK
jgi:tetratricopeptide (TPR) repeat protein/predicted Ser/Thr protein kinase